MDLGCCQGQRFKQVCVKEPGAASFVVGRDGYPFIEADKCAPGKVDPFLRDPGCKRFVSKSGRITGGQAKDGIWLALRLLKDFVRRMTRKGLVIVVHVHWHGAK